MAKITNGLQKNIMDILKNEYEYCDFFMAASNILTHHIKEISDTVSKNNCDFEKLRDDICEIGVYISNTEKRLLEVEECYTKLVEALANEKKDA